MSVLASILRHICSRTFSSSLHIYRLFLIAAPLLIIPAGSSIAAEQGDEWRYWRFGVSEERPYPSQNLPLVDAPPMPEPKYRSHKKRHRHYHDDSAGYEVAPRRKKAKKHAYPEVDSEDYDREDSGYEDSYIPAYSENHHNTGRGFGRLFPDLAEEQQYKDHGPSWRALKALGRSMVEEHPGAPFADSEQPAGYTYFGQFVDHDITFETKTILGNEINNDYELENGRTPDLDLDNVYGEGPKRTPHLFRLPYIRVGRLISEDGASPRFDLFRTKSSYRNGPRGGNAVALLGDPRNDENIILSQLHAAFVAFHNRTADILVEREYGDTRDEYCDGIDRCSTYDLALSLPDDIKAEIFQTARDHVTYYYHRLILDDFLPRVIGPDHSQTANSASSNPP